MEDTINRLKCFILKRAYKRGLNMENLSLDLGIEKDLGFYGDDAAELIYDYGIEFGVDTDNFNFEWYFSPEDLIIYLLRKILPSISSKKKELTIGDLIKGIEVGRLDEEVLSS